MIINIWNGTVHNTYMPNVEILNTVEKMSGQWNQEKAFEWNNFMKKNLINYQKQQKNLEFKSCIIN